MWRKFNKKNEVNGFTLVELLGIIAILALVGVLITFAISNIVKNSKDKGYKVTVNNIEKIAGIYVLENNNNIFWQEGENDSYLYQCVTVQNLIDIGYFKNEVLDSYVTNDRKVMATDYIYLEFDNDTKAVTKNVLLYDDTTESYNTLCNQVNAYGSIIFSVPSGWAREKDVTITYKLSNKVGSLSNYTYDYKLGDGSVISKENGEFNTSYEVEKFKVIENGTIYASIVDIDGNVIDSGEMIIEKIDRMEPVIKISNYTGSSTVYGNVTIPLEIIDNESGVNSKSVSLSDFIVSIGGNEITSGVNLEKIGNNNYNLEIENNTYTGELKIKIDANQIFDNVDNGNVLSLLETGIIFDNIKVVNIKYSVNGGTITSSTGSNSWSTDSDGLIYKNGSLFVTGINYGETLGSDGLVNYDNSGYIYITKTGYGAVDGAEWKCLSGCTVSNKTFSHDVVYDASDFCDASNGDCTVTLGVNWVDNEPPICTLSVTSDGVSIDTSSDNVGVVSSGVSTSNTPSYETSSVSLQTGTIYGYVKDAAGNIGSCSVNVEKQTQLYTCYKNANRINNNIGCDSSCPSDYPHESSNCETRTYYHIYYKNCDIDDNGNEVNCSIQGHPYGSTTCIPGAVYSSTSSHISYYYSCEVLYSITEGTKTCYKYTCSSGHLYGDKCYLYNQTSCASGWSSWISNTSCSSDEYEVLTNTNYCYKLS